MRTTPDITHLIQPLEEIIRMKVIPSLTNRPPPNDDIRCLFALPARLGGLALFNPVSDAQSAFSASTRITKSLTESILAYASEYSYDIMADQLTAKSKIQSSRREMMNKQAEDIKNILPENLKHAMELASEKGASTWLTSLPIDKFGFTLHKGAFYDALALRYDWSPSNIPKSCPCGTSFSIEHALSCPKGGFPILRHNEIRDLTANLLTEVCHEVSIEPDLQPLTGESLRGASSIVEDGARLDIAMNGFWGSKHERSLCDIRIFNPLAPSNRNTNRTSCYRKHERIKKNAYEQRVREIEHSSFTPLIFSATGGMGSEATVFYKRLASLLAIKWDNPYNLLTMSWLQCRLSFSLLRSSIRCIRGARSHRGHAIKSAPIGLIHTESGFHLVE